MWTRDSDHMGYPKAYSHCSKKRSYQEDGYKEKSYKDHSHRSYPNNSHSGEVVQDADQYSNIDQESDELILIKNSYNCCVESTDTRSSSIPTSRFTVSDCISTENYDS